MLGSEGKSRTVDQSDRVTSGRKRIGESFVEVRKNSISIFIYPQRNQIEGVQVVHRVVV